ncbi:MAG: hypothetical protein AB1Z67_08955 [Candidatus Limnocylindrales bacterium]
MSDRNAFDRQLGREIDNLAGPEPRVDVRHIVETATATKRRGWMPSGWGAMRLLAGAAVMLLVVGLGIGFLFDSDRAVVPVPAASPSIEPTPATSTEPAIGTPVVGTWSSPDLSTCHSVEPPVGDDWIVTREVCDGLRFDVPGEPRLTAAGQIRIEEWEEAEWEYVAAPQFWELSNAGGAWESQRYQDHDRYVFRGLGGYAGLNAILTLSEDGTLSGSILGQSTPDEPPAPEETDG